MQSKFLSLVVMATSASAISFRVAHVLQSIATGGTGGPTYVDFKMVTYASDCDLPGVCDRGLLTWEGGDLCAGTEDYPYNVCDRKFRLNLLDGTSACATHDANDDNNSDNIPAGNAYAQLWEGDNRIGTCYVDYNNDDTDVHTCGTSTVSLSNKINCIEGNIDG